MKAKKGDGVLKGIRRLLRHESHLRAGSAAALEDFYRREIGKLGRLIPEDSRFDPVDIVTEIEIDAGHRTYRGKHAARAQSVAVEGIDDVIASIQNVRAVNLELHLRMCARVVAIAEAHVDHGLCCWAIRGNPVCRRNVVADRGGTGYSIFKLRGKVIKADDAEAVFVSGSG